MVALGSTRTTKGPRPWDRSLSFGLDALLVMACAATAWAHAAHLVAGNYLSAAFVAEQTVLLAMVLVRRRPSTSSRRPADWAVAALGGWLPFAMRPTESLSEQLALTGAGVQVVGLMLTSIGFIYLGRSFGVVAANRGLKVNGPYRIVRHPIYFSHTVTLLGFLLVNPSMLNASILVAITLFQLLRIGAEERVLSETDSYRAYADRVRWRLLPGIY